MGFPDGCDPGSEEESGTGLVAEGERQGPARAPCVLWVLVASALGGPYPCCQEISVCSYAKISPDPGCHPHMALQGVLGVDGATSLPTLSWPPTQSCLPLDAGKGAG